MRVLFVTPSEVSSGEAITALHIAENVIAKGGSVRFLASAFTGGFLRKPFSEHVTGFTQDAEQNRQIWDNSLLSFRPEVVVFADYPLLFFSQRGFTAGKRRVGQKSGESGCCYSYS